MTKANGVRWYGHVLRREDGDVLRKALKFKLGEQKRGKTKMTWRTQMDKEIGKVGLKQDVFNQTKWQKGVKKMAMRCAATAVRETPSPFFVRETPH